jgi:hypothetical protein
MAVPAVLEDREAGAAAADSADPAIPADSWAGWPPGSDGRAGNPGAPGTITVSVDPTAQPYEDLLVLSNHSGSGRAGPAPTIAIEPVAPLW